MRHLAVFCLLLTSLAVNAQYYSFGADPSRAKWSVIRSEHFKLIYPRETDSLARIYLCNLEKARTTANESMLIDTKPIPVVLHPYSTFSNGSVSWTPKTVNLITSPNGYSGTPESWTDQLTVHEMRHVGQTEQFTKGIFRTAYWFLGEQGTGIGVGLFASTRFLEGDAVLAETQFSAAGRGRSADFLKYQRALFLDGISLGWDRASFGSYRFQSINHYCLGYTLLAGEQIRTGNYCLSGEFFRDKAHLYDIKRFFEKPENRKYPPKDSMMAYSYRLWGGLWQADLISRGKPTEAERISPERRYYSGITGGIRCGNSVIAVRKGLERSCELVRTDENGNEEHLNWHNPNSSKLSDVLHGRIFWSESTMHNPATLETFSDIRYYDTESGRTGFLTRKTKYFNPCVSEDQGMIAVAEYPVTGGSFLVLLSSEDGSVIERIAAPDDGQIIEPCFAGTALFATVVGDHGIGLYSLDDGQIWQCIVPQQRCDIRHIRSAGGSLLFTSDLDGVLNIYSLETASMTLTKLTNSKYGADYPIADGDGLIFSEFDRNGFHLAKAGREVLCKEVCSFDEPYLHPVAEMLAAIAGENSRNEAVTDTRYLDEEYYPSRNYNKLTNSLHIHSWAPVYYDVDKIRSFSTDNYHELASLGTALYSQNELGTVVTMAGYSYHNGFHSAHGKLTATVMDCDVELTGDLNDRKQLISTPAVDGKESKTVPSERPYWTMSLTVDYPLNLYHGGWNRMFIPYFSLKLSNDITRLPVSSGESAAVQYGTADLRVGARYYRMLPTATAAIFPRLGFSVTAAGMVPMACGSYDAPIVALSSYCYFPGLTTVQGIKISAALQHQFTGRALLISNALVTAPRGYTTVRPEADFAKVTVDYGIPVWLGDVSLGKMLYLKRLELVPFADVAFNRSMTDETGLLCSAGSDMLLKFHILRIGFEMSAGFRYARTLSGDNFFAPLMGVTIK